MPNQIIRVPLTIYRQEKTIKASLVLVRQSQTRLEKIKLTFLHPREVLYFNSLESSIRKHSFLIGRLASKLAISEYLVDANLSNIEIEPGVFKQPVINYPGLQNLQISISHCSEWGSALVFPEVHPMAVDIENLDQQILSNTVFFASVKEMSLFDKFLISDRRKHLLLWTIKESFSKVLKTGLTTSFQIYEVSSITSNDNYFESYFTHFPQYKAITFSISEVLCTIVLPRRSILENIVPATPVSYLNTVMRYGF